MITIRFSSEVPAGGIQLVAYAESDGQFSCEILYASHSFKVSLWWTEIEQLLVIWQYNGKNIPEFQQFQIQTPVACEFPQILDKSPINLIFCILYFIFAIFITASALYFYFYGRNGQQNNRF